MARKSKPKAAQVFDPSKPLADEKHEKFANLIVKGDVSQIDAYVASGFKRATANAARLRKSPKVVARIGWLLEQVAKITIRDAAWIVDRMARHAENLTEVVIGDDGKRMPGPMFSASAGVMALERLGREHGLFKEKIELGGKVALANAEVFQRMTPDERMQMRAMLLAAMQRTPVPANSNAPDQADDDAAGLVPREA